MIIPSAAAIRAALGATWNFVRHEPRALDTIPNTREAFAASFFAAALVAPAYAAIVLFDVEGEPSSWVQLIFVETIGYIVGWTAYPVAMIELARLLGVQRHYFRYIAAYNWFNALVFAAVFAVASLRAAGIVPDEVQLLPVLAMMYYYWRAARSVLEIGGWQAAGLVAIDMLIGTTIAAAMQALR